MINIKEAIIVEGKYDKMRLERVCSSPIFTTEGFRIFKDKEKREFLRNLAKKRGLLILTDSDRAGFMIRNHIKGFVNEGDVRQAYIPEIFGKERRKSLPSKEGKLGVEGIDTAILYDLLLNFSTKIDENSKKKKYTKSDLYELGLSGGENSKEKREELAKRLGLPKDMTPSALLEAINLLGIEL